MFSFPEDLLSLYVFIFIARVCVYACQQCPWMLKRESEPQQMELQTVVSCLAAGDQTGSSARAWGGGQDLNH